MTDNLDDMYKKAAKECRSEGVPLDANPNGAIHDWVRANVNHRPDTTFFIVNGIAAAMADLDAQSEGYENQFDRAAKRAFAKHEEPSQ